MTELESDFSIFMPKEQEHPAFADFKEMLVGKAWDPPELRAAWVSFATGWNCAYQTHCFNKAPNKREVAIAMAYASLDKVAGIPDLNAAIDLAKAVIRFRRKVPA